MPDQEPDLRDMEVRFHQEILDTYESLKRKYRHNASYFLQMLVEYDGIEIARRLLCDTISKEEPDAVLQLRGPHDDS